MICTPTTLTLKFCFYSNWLSHTLTSCDQDIQVILFVAQAIKLSRHCIVFFKGTLDLACNATLTCMTGLRFIFSMAI